MEDNPKYPSGPASLFHIAATTPKINPIWCDTCMKDSAEFVKDVGRFEVYQCVHCGLQRDIAVR